MLNLLLKCLSGRRCDTGEGIYAFRCRRASLLFRTLQQNIQLRNVISDSLPFQLPANLSNSPQSMPRQTLQASIVHRSSVDSGQPEPNGNNLPHQTMQQTRATNNVNQSPRSPSSVDILEVMPLNPRPQTNTNQTTNVYQMRGFKSREHNNNQAEGNAEPRHLYSNDFNRDLALLRSSLRQEAALNTIKDIEDETQFIQSRYMNDHIPVNNSNVPLSPTLSSVSEHYAQLSMEQQESARLYVNIAPADLSLREIAKHETIPTTPLTPKQVDYYNFNINAKPEMNSYANLSLGELGESINHVKHSLHFNLLSGEHTHKYSESDTYTSMSPVEELEVNYAVLDIDTNKDASRLRELTSPESQSYASSKNESTTSQCSNHQRGRLISQGSTERAPVSNASPSTTPAAGIGYTTIDFDKTVALTSVASGTDVDLEATRKMRHNSVNMCNSPTSTEKSRGN